MGKDSAGLILPIALAVVGGVLTGGAGWAISAGFLVGSWLYQSQFAEEDNNIFDPGANEMPSFNQALRGVTMPITFGTNRVASNLVWQKNFATIRHESNKGGGGGKGGGSGMGAKGGGGSTTGVTYEYRWDMLMHLGMSDETDVSLFGGWLGAERLNTDTLLAIINNSNSGFGSFFRSDVDRPQNASISFEEGFFHGALPTSDSGTGQNWGHFETEEGQPYRFPYTYYIGFKQLNLGSHARVPQLSWEIGPGEINLTGDSGFLDYWSSHSVTKSAGSGASAGMIVGDDGELYQVDFAAGNTVFRLRNVDTGVTIETRTDSEFDADATSTGLDPGSDHVFTNVQGCNVIPGKNLIIAMGRSIVSTSNYAFLLYKVDALGALEIVGGYQGRGDALEGPENHWVVGVFGEGTDDDPIVLLGISTVSSDDELFVWKLPSVNQFISITIEDTASNNFDTRGQSLRTAVTEIQDNFGHHGSYRPWLSGAIGFMVPTLELTPLPDWKTKLMFYIGKSDIEWHIDNPAHSNGTDTIYDITGTWPDGVLYSVTISGALGLSFTIDGTVTVENENFIDKVTNVPAIPFADSGRLVDETTIDDSEDYDPTPQFQSITSGAAAGATLVIFWKNSAGSSSDRPAENTFTKARVFIWNPLTQQAQQYATKAGPFADASADWGVGGAWTNGSISGFFSEARELVYVGGTANGGGANDEIFASTFAAFNIGGGEDVLPPFIIHQILTSPIYGIGIDPDVINSSAYQIALQYCDAQNIRVSVQYKREESVLQAINDLLALYGGYLVDSGGEIKFGLTKFTESADLIRTIDNDHLVVDNEEAPVSITRGARQDTFNKIKVNYIDRNLEYRQNFVEIADEVDIDLNGPRASEFPPKFVMTEELANNLAVRALWSNLYARDIYDFKLGPKDADLEPGDVVTLVDSHHPTLSTGKQVRIVGWEEPEVLKFRVRAVDDVQYIAEAELAVNSQTQATQSTLFGPANPAADFTMYELPKEFQAANAQVFVGYRQQNAAMGARLYTSADGVSFAQVQEVQPFIISGIMADALPSRDPGFVDESIEVFLMPDTASGNFSVNSFVYAQTFALDDVSASGRALGAGLLWINSEMMAYQGVTLLGQNRYKFDKVFRGWGGTHIQGHSSGDTWHKHGGGVFNQSINEDKIGTIVHYKVAPFNFSGVEFDIASVDARTYQIQGTFFRPQNPAPIKTFVQSPGSFLTIQSEDLGVIAKKAVIAGGSDVQFEWDDASRDRGFGTRGYGAGGYGRFETDTTSHQYRVEVLSSNLITVVRCTTVSTFAFTYSSDINSTDFNGWFGSFAVRITPFNEFGDALRNRTKILELFE